MPPRASSRSRGKSATKSKSKSPGKKIPVKAGKRKGAKKGSGKSQAAKKAARISASKKSSYQEKKEHKGKSYSGMRVGRTHRWEYRDGVWHEKKVEPSRWEIAFASNKHRKAKAPEGSGAGPGSGYHWLIIADQWVQKKDANTYATLMEGEKHLVSFRKPEWDSWNTQFANQPSARKKTIKLLRQVLERLEEQEKEEAEPKSIENPSDHPAFTRMKIRQAKPSVVKEVAPQ